MSLSSPRFVEARRTFSLSRVKLVLGLSATTVLIACNLSNKDNDSNSALLSDSQSSDTAMSETNGGESGGGQGANEESPGDSANDDSQSDTKNSEGPDPSSGDGDPANSDPTGASDDTDSPEEDDTDDEEPRFDVAAPEGMDIPRPPKEGDTCRGVDVLFVIDGSGSMDIERGKIANSVPGFAKAMQERLDIIDGYHIGITTPGAGMKDEGPPPWANMMYPNLVSREQCDKRGSLTDTCEYKKGRSFMTEHDADESFEGKLQCAINNKINWDGDEQPMAAMITATSPANSEAEACNQYFMRDDAVLVIVNVTDEEDDHEDFNWDPPYTGGSPGHPENWFEQIVANKGGVESNIVVLTIAGLPGSWCGDETPRLVDFTNRFTYGFARDVCANDYTEFFEEALDSIESACEEFMPVE